MRQNRKKIVRAGVVGAMIALALAGFLLLSVAPAFAQSGTWQQPGGAKQKSTGTWQWTKQNAKGTATRIENELRDFYKKSPNLQTGVEVLQTVISVISDAGSSEALPPVVGDLAGVLMNSPDTTRAALSVWLRKKANDAAIAMDFERSNRYDAFLSCLYGDCAALHALAQTRVAPPRRHTGRPENIVITSVVAFPSVIKEGETARITVSARTVVGGEVVITLQSQGSAISGLRKVKPSAAPGETVTFTFDQGFETAGEFRLRALARDPRSDDSDDGYITVTKKEAPPPPPPPTPPQPPLPPPPAQENSGNSGKLTGDGLELEWNVSGADVGKRSFSERTWQAGGVLTAPTVRFWGVMRASVPARLVTDSSMSAYISMGMGAGKKEAKWGGPLGGDHGSSHELPFDLSLDVAPGAAVLVSASVSKVGGVADLLGLFFQFSPAPKAKSEPALQANPPPPPPPPQPPKPKCSGACLAPRDVCVKTVESWTPALATLDAEISRHARELEVWRAERRAQDEGWLNGMVDWFLGPGAGAPNPPAGAQLNTNRGERECLVGLLNECRAEITRVEKDAGGPSVTADSSAADYRGAFEAYAAKLASTYQARGEEHWGISQQRKAALAASPKEFRFAAEALQEAGYADACRRAAEQLRALRPGGR